MGHLSRFAILLSWTLVVLATCSVASAQSWYHREGPLRGSLKSGRPLPLYDSDREHLWNRLFAAFYIRPSELPSRPQYPDDSTRLDEWDRKLRTGELHAGPIVRRIEGGDVLGILAWPKTRYFSEPSTFQRANRLLDEFIKINGERLIEDPLKRAFFQRDLWVVFDHLVGQNIARFGDADLFRRRNTIPSHEIDTSAPSRPHVGQEEDDLEDRGAIQRRKILCRKLATIIKRLALPKSVIENLPDNYAAAIRSGRFSAEHDFDPSRDYLPPDLLGQPSEWLEIDTSPEPVHSDKREGQLMLLVWSIRGRSYYRVFWRFPDGRRAVEDYLEYLRREGVDWEKSARQGYIALRPDVQQIPVGTEAAIVQFMIVLDERLEPVPTRVVESVHLSVYKNVDGTPDPQTNTGRGLIATEYVVRRRLLFDGLKQGGLLRSADVSDAAQHVSGLGRVRSSAVGGPDLSSLPHVQRGQGRCLQFELDLLPRTRSRHAGDCHPDGVRRHSHLLSGGTGHTLEARAGGLSATGGVCAGHIEGPLTTTWRLRLKRTSG